MNELALNEKHIINQNEKDFIWKCFEQPILVYFYLNDMIHNNKIPQTSDFKNYVIENYFERNYLLIKINEIITAERQ